MNYEQKELTESGEAMPQPEDNLLVNPGFERKLTMQPWRGGGEVIKESGNSFLQMNLTTGDQEISQTLEAVKALEVDIEFVYRTSKDFTPTTMTLAFERGDEQVAYLPVEISATTEWTPVEWELRDIDEGNLTIRVTAEKTDGELHLDGFRLTAVK